MTSNGKREINSTIYPVPKNDSANTKAKEEHVSLVWLSQASLEFSEDRRKVPVFHHLLKNSE